MSQVHAQMEQQLANQPYSKTGDPQYVATPSSQVGVPATATRQPSIYSDGGVVRPIQQTQPVATDASRTAPYMPPGFAAALNANPQIGMRVSQMINNAGPTPSDTSSTSNAMMKGIFVAEGTHFMDTDHNWGAQSYDLSKIPVNYGNLLNFEQYEPRSWLSNSEPVQLEQLNNEIFHFQDLPFASTFLVGAPSTISEVVQSTSSYSGLYGQPNGMNPVTATDQRVNAGNGSTIQSNTSQPNPASSWWDRVNFNQAKEGGRDIGAGVSTALLGYRGLQTPAQFGTQIVNRVNNPLLNDAVGIQNQEEAPVDEGPGFEAENGPVPGEEPIYEGPGFEEEAGNAAMEGVETTAEVGELGELAAGTAEVGAVAAEGAGLATVIGATGGAAAIGIGAALAVYGAYEVATGLGAPTISQDVDFLGNEFKKASSWFNP